VRGRGKRPLERGMRVRLRLWGESEGEGKEEKVRKKSTRVKKKGRYND
jgi:hypothetical protein